MKAYGTGLAGRKFECCDMRNGCSRRRGPGSCKKNPQHMQWRRRARRLAREEIKEEIEDDSRNMAR